MAERQGDTEIRSTPRDLAAQDRVGPPAETGAVADRGRQMEFWPEVTNIRQRFGELQAEFIEEPRAAVKKAEALIDETVEQLMSSVKNHLQTIHGRAGGDADTEQLRVAMLSYRDFLDSLAKRRAA